MRQLADHNTEPAPVAVASDLATTCRWCSSSSLGEPLAAREMMFGSRRKYEYRKCRSCGSLGRDLSTVPAEDLYPPAYYSLARGNDVSSFRYRPIAPLRATTDVLLKYPLGVTQIERAGIPLRRGAFLQWFGATGIHRRSRILDIGSGDGGLLRLLARMGFTNLFGIDPHLEAELHDAPVELRRMDVRSVDRAQRFDVVMLHHVLEHLDNPAEELVKVRALLSPSGLLVLRVPVVDSWAAATYGANWVQLDAPRHQAIPTVKALIDAAEAAGFALQRTFRDSTAFQIWGSEQYRQGVPLRDPRSWAEGSRSGPITRPFVLRASLRAIGLNRAAKGDQVCAVFRPA
jgi:SAM-dependent methyltransferase